jgi:hypothetical protein
MLGLLVVLWSPKGTAVSSSWTRSSGGGGAPGLIAAEAKPLPGGLLDLRLDESLYAGENTVLQAELDEALAYVSARFGSAPDRMITASIKLNESCGLHGIAYTDIRDAQVFSCNSIPRERAVAILAHEFVHQLAQDRYGPPHLSADMILLEGVATWGAGRYWLGTHPDFRSYVREERRSGVAYPLATDYSGLGPDVMNALYYQWASFVEFLIDQYGRESFDRLYVSGSGAPGSANYVGVYGKTLTELEGEWERWADG